MNIAVKHTGTMNCIDSTVAVNIQNMHGVESKPRPDQDHNTFSTLLLWHPNTEKLRPRLETSTHCCVCPSPFATAWPLQEAPL